jgi:pyruvate-formate lyase-activating enzyme
MRIPASVELALGDRGFDDGLLVELIGALRRVRRGDLVAFTTTRDVTEPLDKWSRLTGNAVVERTRAERGFRWVVRNGEAPDREEARPIGSRLWVYTNFHCNLACDYCCVRSSPKAEPRALGLDVVRRLAAEAGELGVAELLVTGGEPFLLEDIGEMLGACARAAPTTVLTNGMLFAGSRRRALDALPRDRVVVQVSLDSATAEQHDRRRGAGAWDKAWRGIEIARAMGFRVRVAATVEDEQQDRAVRAYFDGCKLDERDRVVRRVALRGFAGEGVALGRGDLAPEPTVTARGLYWHPVGATDDDFFVAADVFPLARAFEAVRVAYESQRAFASALESVFVCA